LFTLSALIYLVDLQTSEKTEIASLLYTFVIIGTRSHLLDLKHWF